MTRSKGPTTTTTEAFDRFRLTLTHDARGRLRSATLDKRKLVCDPDVPIGELTGPDGGETWAEGRAVGSWLDMPYAHECDVDRGVSYDDWVDDSLRELRSAAFSCGADHAAPTGALAAAVMDYALDHALLANRIINPWAEKTLANAWAHGTPSQQAAWKAHIKRHRLARYADVLRAR